MFTQDEVRRMRAFLRDYGRYRGFLSSEQLASGISHCIQNAADILDDARVLAEHGRAARALSLACSSLEESGKAQVLLAMARIPKENQKLWRDQWAHFRDHLHKGAHGMVVGFPRDQVDEASLLQAALTQRAIAPLMEQVRQVGLYVDYRQTTKTWSTPRDVRPEDADRVIEWAERAITRLREIEASGAASPQGLRITREVVGSLLRGLPRLKDMSASDLDAVMQDRADVFLEYYRRMVEGGVMDRSFDVGGQTIGELLDEHGVG